MSYYTERDSHTRNKTKLLLSLSNYETKPNLKLVTGVDISNFAVDVD